MKLKVLLLIALLMMPLASAFTSDNGWRINTNIISFKNETTQLGAVSGSGEYVSGQFQSGFFGRLWQRMAVFFEADSEPPTFTVDSPEAKTYSSGIISVKYTADSTAVDIFYNIDGRDNLTLNGNTTLSTNEGIHVFRFYVRDRNLNEGTQSIQFTVALEGGQGAQGGGESSTDTKEEPPIETAIIIEPAVINTAVETFDEVQNKIKLNPVIFSVIGLAMIISTKLIRKRKFDSVSFMGVLLIFTSNSEKIFDYLNKAPFISPIIVKLNELFLFVGKNTGTQDPIFFGATITLIGGFILYNLFIKKDILNTRRKAKNDLNL